MMYDHEPPTYNDTLPDALEDLWEVYATGLAFISAVYKLLQGRKKYWITPIVVGIALVALVAV